MDRQNFLQTGGFPFEADTLDGMQTAYDLLNALGAVAGNYAILTGCEVVSGAAANGVVYINGEVFRFQGGTVGSTVRVLETVTSKTFENGESKPVHRARYAAFATGSGSIPWTSFKRVESILSLQGRILPAGTNPQLFTGAVGSIPAGWQLCDGTNGTPDLRGRFIVGLHPADTDYNAIGKTGGEKTVTLSLAQMPSHSHTGSTNTAGSHTHTTTGYAKVDESTRDGGGQRTAADEGNSPPTGSAGAHSHTLTTNSQGSGQAHENRPPYYTLAYIIYTG